ncbi:MAG: CapA family protein [Oscillospiraceae bacterium]|jgi:poly-gamma-glutamate synthesis protein (capsule biosynthesis protein)|nr:CapA family protein [Oscillospiraceae bacterium]
MSKPTKNLIITGSIALPAVLLLAVTAILFTLSLKPKAAKASPVIPAAVGVQMEDKSAPSSEPEEAVSTVKIALAGDVLLHKSVYEAAQTGKNTYDFTPYFSLAGKLFEGDLNMLNMEGPVDARGKNNFVNTFPCFNAPIEILDALKGIGVDTLITANNHAFDTSAEGMLKTRENIIAKGLEPVGTFATAEQSTTPYIKEVNGVKIGIAAFTDSVNGIKIKYPYSRFAINKIPNTEEAADIILKKVEELRAAGAEYTIVSLHWGKEYGDAPLEWQVTVAKKLAENGVDLIFGNHSHCVQPIERLKVSYKGREKESLIVYSIGNFFVNQTSNGKAKTQYGIVLNLKLAKQKSGEISLGELSCTPTYMYYNTKAKGKDAFKLVPAIEYSNAAQKPDFFKNEEEWKECNAAVEHVKSILGDVVTYK